MKKTPHTLPGVIIYLFFAIGVLSALAFRSLTIINRFDEALFRPVWYGGVLGYILFFAYRYYISEKRKSVIKDYRLLEKVAHAEMSSEDRAVLHYLLSSIVKSKEHFNYLIIFILSLLAIAIDLLLGG